jgi:ABC-type transport system involved in multi-copper enzyme maturation permease subunit
MHANPVLGRELRERMRGPRAFVALTVYLCVLVLAVVISYKGNSELDSFDAAFDLGRRTAVGRQVLEWVLLTMLVLVLFLVPGFTAGAVAGERERQTLVPLQVTLLRPRSILWGKASAALAFIALLVIAAAPLLAVAFLLGGISVGQAMAGLFGVLAVALVLALIVVGISALVRRVQAATVVAYAVTFLLAIGSFVVYGVAGLVTEDEVGENDPPGWLLVPNPIVLVADLAAGNGVGDGPLESISDTVRDAQDREQDVFGGRGDGPAVFEGDVAVAAPGVEPDGRGDPVWPWSLLSLAVLAALFFAAGVHRLRTPAEAER